MWKDSWVLTVYGRKPPSRVVNENMGSGKNRSGWEAERDSPGIGGIGGLMAEAHVREGQVLSQTRAEKLPLGKNQRLKAGSFAF